MGKRTCRTPSLAVDSGVKRNADARQIRKQVELAFSKFMTPSLDTKLTNGVVSRYGDTKLRDAGSS